MTRIMLFCLGAATLASAQTPQSFRSFSKLFEDLVDRVHPAVVQIVTRGYSAADEGGVAMLRAQRGSGSGVVVDPEGYIVTNAHVVGAARRVDVLLADKPEDRARWRSILKPHGRLTPAKVVGIDRETDIAVLKVEAKGLPHLRFADSEQIRQGQLVIALGSPFGLDNSVTMGVVSSVARQVRPDDTMIYIQTDAAINPGNSGGPLVDSEGAVTGINTFIVSQGGGSVGVGFAVPANIARTAYDQIRKHGRVRRGQIGVVAQTVTPSMARALSIAQTWGAIIADVAPQSPAEAAGLEVRDVVVSLNGKPIENARQFGVNIYQNAGETIRLELLRGERKLEKQVAVGERPRDPDRLLSLITNERNAVAKLGVIAVDLDEKVTPLLPPLRRLQGAVVAGVTGEPSGDDDSLLTGDVIYAVNQTAVTSVEQLKNVLAPLGQGQTVVLHVERLGQQQFLTLEID